MSEKNHDYRTPYAVAEHVRELKTSGRRAECARQLIAGKTQLEVMNFLVDTFGMSWKQAKSEYRQALSYIYLECEIAKDEIRNMNLARLEKLFMEAETDDQLAAKDYYQTQFRNIDLVNKTAQLYDNEQVNKVDTDINFNLKLPEKSDE